MSATAATRSAAATTGSLLGAAVGDAVGLPYEGLTPARAAALLGEPDRLRLVWGRGMVSDDCEHACLTAAALARSGGDVDRFTRELGRQLRWWFAALPAGVGLATARACLKLWLGASPHTSGVHSAGNGAAMRAAILGATITDRDRLARLVDASSRTTHRDERALDGALVVAAAARLAASGALDASELARDLAEYRRPQDDAFARLLDDAFRSVEAHEPTLAFAARHGMARGVSGFIVHTVPVAVHAALSHPRDVRNAVMACVRCGGDTDSTAAIAGGIVGAQSGPDGVPDDWLAALWTAPRSLAWMRALAAAATEAARNAEPEPVPSFAWPLVPLRNAAFLGVVVLHGLRRLLPPY
ncbi:MAG: ADP-ribosylglycohydrolase family protein [Phycisphaerae bacterium]|nr:ADP-ribosylglycohydrolase family protein [Phycisphaerae bacterium]